MLHSADQNIFVIECRIECKIVESISKAGTKFILKNDWTHTLLALDLAVQ